MSKVYKHIAKPLHCVPAREELGIAHNELITRDTLKDILLVGGLARRMNTLIGSLIAEEGLWTEAMDLAMSDNDQVAFRASWGVEWAYSTNMDRFNEFIPRFVGDYINARNHSVNRVYSKMLCDMLRRGVVELTGEQAIEVAEKSFDLLVDPDTATAIRAWTIELLWDLSGHADWIEENLTEIVRDMSEKPDCSAGEAAHARHYFKRLAKKKECSRP